MVDIVIMTFLRGCAIKVRHSLFIGKKDRKNIISALLLLVAMTDNFGRIRYGCGRIRLDEILLDTLWLGPYFVDVTCPSSCGKTSERPLFSV